MAQFQLLERVQVKPLFPIIGIFFASQARCQAAGKIGRIGEMQTDPETGEPQYIVVVPKTGDRFCLTADDLDHPSPS